MATYFKAQTAELERILHVPIANTLYDFSPCLTAPAVQKVASVSANTPVLIQIPPSPYPSPLADYLTPDIVKGLYDHLCGPANNNNKGKYRRRGEEVWLSWKRAWDLYNNYYIEGRENPAWISQEYKKLKREFEDERAAKRLQDLNRSSFKARRLPPATTGPYKRVFTDSEFSPNNRPGRRWKRTSFEGKIVKKTGKQVSLRGGGISFIQDASAKREVLCTLPDGAPTKTYLAGEYVPLIHQSVPKYKTTIEYVAVAKPAQPLELINYHGVQSKREKGNKTNPAEERAFFKARNDAMNENLPAPLDEDFKSTTRPPLVEDVVEDATIEVQEILMKRPIGDLEEVQVETDGLIFPPLGYMSLQASRDKEAKATVLKETGAEKKIIKKILRWKDTATQVMLENPYCSDPRLQRYPEDIVEVDLQIAGVILSSETKYVHAPVGTMVDDVTVESLLEWQEVDLPNPDKIRRSHAHSVVTQSQNRRKVSFGIFNKGRSSSTQAAAQDKGTIPTDIDNPNIMYPASSDLNNTVEVTMEAIQQSLVSQTALEDDDDDDESDSEDSSGSTPFNRRMPSGSYLDDQDAPIPHPRAEDVEEKDGSHESGGFKPMKYLLDYVVPDPDVMPGDEQDWTDAIENTVWRPRRTGEKALKIELDEDVEKLSTELEVFGGVDCGRSPYPVLRSVTKYVEFKSRNGGGIVKKKVWDGVTGTVFNMPSVPLEEDSELRDDRLNRMRTLYGDHFRDKRDQPNKAIFPLDIRRVDRIDTISTKRRGPALLLGRGEKELQFRWRDPLRLYSDLPDTDPWWVTAEQERLRDVPPRKYPPVEGISPGDLLYTDNTLWQEEVGNDSTLHSRYFVTNLHGGTLIINGVEVRKGCVAGPLPEFAIIECPGDQVAFWHGPGGRFWGEGSPDTQYDYRWETLRQLEGFENIALTAGQVWNVLIKDRLRRELTGNRLEDDEEWALWKSTETSPVAAQPTGAMEFPKVQLKVDFDLSLSGTVPANGSESNEPDFFLTEEDEFRWLKTRAIPLEVAASKAVLDSTIRSTPETFWAIDPEDKFPDPPEVVEQRKADNEFDINKHQILNQQRAATKHYMNQKIDREEIAATNLQIEKEDRKRKSDAMFPQPPAAKRTKAELDRDQFLAYKKHQAEYRQATEDVRIWKEHIAREAAKARKMSENLSYGDEDWKSELEAHLDALQNRWLVTNRKRMRDGLAPFDGLSPRVQASVDEKRLLHLLKRAADIEAELLKKVKDRKDAKAAATKAKLVKLDALQQSKDAKAAKRTAMEAQLTNHEKLARKRKAAFDALLPFVENIKKQQKTYEQQAANATRVNRAVNGLYSEAHVVQAVVLPPPPSPLFTQLVRSKTPPPAKSPSPPPVGFSLTPSRSSDIISEAAPQRPIITSQAAPGGAQSRVSSPVVPTVPIISNRPSIHSTWETLIGAAVFPIIPDDGFVVRPARLPTPLNSNDNETNNTSPPPRPISSPLNWDHPHDLPSTPCVSKSGSSKASAPASPATSLSEIPSPYIRAQSSSPGRVESSTPGLRGQSAIHSRSRSPDFLQAAPVPEQEALPVSGFDSSEYMTREDLRKLPAQEQLQYVLASGLELIPEAPKCQQHEYLIETVGAENVDAYLSIILKENPTITSYLNSQLRSPLILQEDVNTLIQEYPAVAESMQQHIYMCLRSHYEHRIRQSKTSINRQEWAINKYAKDVGIKDHTMTFDRLMRILTEDIVKDLEKYPVSDRDRVVGNLIACKLGLHAKIVNEHGKHKQVQVGRDRFGNSVRMCEV